MTAETLQGRQRTESRFVRVALAITALVLVLLCGSAYSQDVQLTAEQRRMLDQLPPAQREQALRAIRDMQANRGEAGGQQSSLAEELSTPPGQDEAGEAATGVALVAEPRSRLIVNLAPRGGAAGSERGRIESDPVLREIQGSHYYVLDDNGELTIPGLSPVALLGLTAEQIETRLGAVPRLRPFDVGVAILPVEVSGPEALEPFGYDLFEDNAYGLDPVTSGPVPVDYVLGPGDTVRVQLFGNENGVYEFEISRDGILNLPRLGPVTVAGLRFSEFREDLEERVREMLIGTQVSVSIGRLRTIRVFVFGDANRPGSYVVNSLATISTALYASGGISDIGSLRDIQLKRQGRIVARFDLYDLLLSGDTSDDVRLSPGDVIFIPPLGETVGVSGAVRRPAIYELRGRTSVAELLRMAGGLLPDAYPGAARIERISGDRRRVVIAADLGRASREIGVQGGDTLIVPRVMDRFSGAVTLAGSVAHPGRYQWRPGLRLTDVLFSAEDLEPGADLDYVLIRREDPMTRRISVHSANLARALADPRSDENIGITDRDTIYVFNLAHGRQSIIQPLLEELELQARLDEPFEEVDVSGRVKAPGQYPLEPGMRVSDLLRAGGNLAEDAFTLDAELTRYEVVGGEIRTVEVIEIDLARILAGDASADVVLRPHDHLLISSVPKWDLEWTVELEGEVMFPGEYRIRRGETLRQILERAGGLTEDAFAPGAVFLRDSLRAREQEQIEMLARRLEADITSLSLETLDTTGSEALATGQELLAQLRATEAVGRLVIDLDRIMAAEAGRPTPADIELRDGDRLLVPRRPQEVTIIGEIQQNTSHLYQPGLSRDDYIAMSGGLTRRADKKLIYVVRASGAVVTNNRSRWLGRQRDTDIRPGDTIVVPLETDRIRPLALWGSVTQILYQAALAVAAVQTFNN